MVSKPFTEWLEERVIQGEGDCLIWQRAMSSTTKPNAWYGGQTRNVRNLVFDHFFPKKRKTNFVRMTCGDTRCLNHEHMKLITDSECKKQIWANRRMDKASMRAAREWAPILKLNESKVAEIRKRKAEGAEINAVAMEFGISRNHVGRIWRGVCWAEAANGSSVFAWRPAA